MAPPGAAADGSPLQNAQRIVVSLRKTTLAGFGLAMEKWGESLPREQEALMALSDLMIETFTAESAVLRAAQAVSAGHPLASLHVDAASVAAHDSGLRAEATMRTLLASMQTDDALRVSLAGLRRILKVPPMDTVAARRRIADSVNERRHYIFGARS